MSALGDRIRKARTEKKLSVYALSKLVGASRNHIGQMEKGERGKNPGSELITKIAESLGVREKWLMDGEGPQFVGDTGTPDKLPARAAAIRAWRKPYEKAIQAVTSVRFDGANELTEMDWIVRLNEEVKAFQRGLENDPRKKKGARIATEADD